MAWITKRWRRLDRLLVATVILPTACAVLYYGLIASDVYISESRFVVRSPERQTASPLGLILKGAGFARADDDAYAVQDFMLSRDALLALDADLQARQLFGDPDIDVFSRFPGLDWDDSFENFHEYYQGLVEVQIDSLSSISTLTVRAFDPGSAQSINQRLLQLAEGLVNRLNERGRQDMVRFAALEVAEAEKRATEAGLALARYRDMAGIIDPEKQSVIPLEQIAALQEQLIATKGQIAQLERVAKDNPQLPALRLRASMLEQEIGTLTRKVAGGSKSLAGKAAEFRRLYLEKEFADKMLASAMSSLEQARSEAQRQQLYLETLVQPNLPDSALEPRRLRAIGAVLIIGLLSWGVLSMLVAGVREHQD